MSKEKVSISKEGFTATLLTYLSEYSISLIILAYFVVAYYYPVFRNPLSNYLHIRVSLEMKIFISFLILMLLHPLGSLITISSWALLGWLEKWEETWHFQNVCFLSKGIKDYLIFFAVKQKFNLTKETFYDTARQKEHQIQATKPKKLQTIDFALGNSVFIRNLSFCVLIVAIIHFINLQCSVGILMFLVFIILTVLNSLAAFYYSLYVLNIASNLCKDDILPSTLEQ